MRVDSFDNFATVGEFDAGSGSIRAMPRESSPAEAVRGHFAELGDMTAVLYRDQQSLRLRIGDAVYPLAEGTEIHWRQISAPTWDDNWTLTGRAVSELTAAAPEIGTTTVRYESGVPSGPPLSMDLSPTDEEDWDFGLFVRNVFADEPRRAGIYPEPAET
jgi:hypothetical protein